MDGLLYLVQWGGDYCYCCCCCCCCYYYYYYYKCYGLECCQSHSYRALYKNLGLKLLHSSMQTSADYRSRRRHVSKQASLFAQLINKAIISMNNVQGQAARIAHKAQHCWPPCIKNLTKKQINIYMYSCMTDEKGETWSPSGMSKVWSRPECLVADCSMHALQPPESRRG